VDGCSTRSRRIDGSTAQIWEPEGGCRRVGQHIEIDLRLHIEDTRRKLRDEVLASDAREMRPHTRDQWSLNDTQPEEIRQRRPLAGPIKTKIVSPVLAMSVVERVVCVPLVMERPNASAFEACAKAKPPAEGRLDVPREGPRRRTIRRQGGMKMIIRSTERQETALVTLREHDTGDDASRSSSSSNGAVILETHRHVESDRLPRVVGIEHGRFERMSVRSVSKAKA
jgi:hypothetical protein